VGIAGVLRLPLGWRAASLLTAGLIDLMSDQSFLAPEKSGGAGYGSQNLMRLDRGWIIIQKAISTGAQVVQALAATVATVGAAGAMARSDAAPVLWQGIRAKTPAEALCIFATSATTAIEISGGQG